MTTFEFDEPFDKLHEECGIIAVYGHPEAGNLAHLGLHALQHRGQESAGIATCDGKEIFFLGSDSKLMAAPIKSLSPFEPGEPVALFQTTSQFNVGQRYFDVSRDGSRFIMNTTRAAAKQAPLTVIQNWKALLKQ